MKKKERIWFVVDCPNTDERLDVCNFMGANFHLTPQEFGSGLRNHAQIDYYCFSREKKRAVRKAIRRAFPKSKVL